MKRFLRLISIFLIPVLFISCRNFFGNDDYDDESDASESGYVIQGTITQSEVSDAVYRTAFPAQPLGTVYYRITAKCGEETVEEKSISASTDFSLKIPHVGDWTVFAEGSTDNGFNTLILKSEEKLLRISDESPMGYANLVLKPYVSENGTGKINLSITIPTAVSTVAVNCISDNKNSFTGVGINVSRPILTIGDNSNNIKSGSYTVEISFKGTVSGVANVLLYHVTEVINVYDNLITDTWVKHGDEPYINATGNFEITDAMIQDFMFSTVYVGGEGKDDENTGTFLSPVSTLTKAFSIPNARNFYITGEVTASSQFTVVENGFLRKHPSAETAKISVTHTDSSLILVNASKTFEISNVTITGLGSSSPMYQAGIVNNGDLTLNNCVISEFYRSSESGQNGGAIYNSAGTLTINGGKISNCGAFNGGAVCNLATCNINGVEFSQNKATGMGGGAISNSSTGKVSISGYGTTNTLFIKNESTAFTDMVVGNKNGGGAILNVGELELENCQFYENSVKFGVGGAIYNMTNASRTKIGKTDNSGTSPVVIGKITKPNYVTASDSTGNSKGGAIYNEGDLYMHKGTCIGDTSVLSAPTSTDSAANYAHEGGGVYNIGTFRIEGGEIKGNLAVRKDITHPVDGTKWVNGIGSGIYCASGSTVSFYGGLITYNSSFTSSPANTVKGSGIYVAGILDMSGNATVADNNDIYLVTSKTINLQNALTATGTVATITPQYYNLDASGNEVDPIQLLAESSTGLIAGNYSKFAVKSKDSNPAIEWYVTVNGKLNSKAPGDVLFATLKGEIPADTTKVYVMDTKGELETLAGWVNTGNSLAGIHFKLNTDITLDSEWTNEKRIGNNPDNPFKGRFDGNNKTITYDSAEYALFACTENAEISYVITKGTFKPKSTPNGAVVNILKGGKIYNCVNYATITANSTDVGGIVGKAVSVDGDLTCLIENCSNYGNITTDKNIANMGGIVGIATSVTVRNCYNAGNITGPYSIGGIAGETNANYPEGTRGSLYENCGNIGTIEATQTDTATKSGAGGIVGGIPSNTELYRPEFINCWSLGMIKANNNNYKGALLGTLYYKEFTNCYYNNTVISYIAAQTQTLSGVASTNDNDSLVNKLNAWAINNGKTEYKTWVVIDGKVVLQ